MKNTKHAYRPLAFFGGSVLKYAGVVAESKREFWAAHWATDLDNGLYLPGVVYLDERPADRITADGHKPFGGC